MKKYHQHNSEQSINTSIVIVGGGTAGWLTAGIIAGHLSSIKSRIKTQVTLIESANTPSIGVGEGTWPTMRRTLKKIGISETQFIKECDASLKQGSTFLKWADGSKNDSYCHPFMIPKNNVKSFLIGQKDKRSNHLPFSKYSSPQEWLIEKGVAAKHITTPEYESDTNYGYHLDSNAFANLLREHCIKNLNVTHIIDDITCVTPSNNGDILAVESKKEGLHHGDLFIDCTGFKSLLIGQHYRVPFISKKDFLFIDKAIATKVNYENTKSPIACTTLSVAQPAGWIWDIGLFSRKGVGHVYSSQHRSDDEALNDLKQYIQKSSSNNIEEIAVKHLQFEPGHRELFWQNNCVAIGLSAGFVEPLEASAIALIEQSATAIAEQLPLDAVSLKESMPIMAKKFNCMLSDRWHKIIDFLKLHYVLSQRCDNAFWQDHRHQDSQPQRLKELLTLWKNRTLLASDFEQKLEIFSKESYEYILYGMGFKHNLIEDKATEKELFAAQKAFEHVKVTKDKLILELTSHRELLEKIHQYGLQRI